MINDSQTYSYQAEKLVNESGDKMDAADKEALTTKAAAVKDAIAKNDKTMIDAAKEDLQKKLYEVSSKMYQQAAPQQNPQGAPDMGNMGGNPYGQTPNGGAQPNGNVYDADFTDVDGQN